MKKLSLLLLCVGFLPTTYSFAQDEWKTCPPSLKGADLTKWRKVLVKKVVEGQYQEVSAAIKTCFEGGAPACYKDMNYYIDSKTGQLPYVDNYADKKDLTLKAPSDLPKEFQTPGDPNKVIIPKDILELAKKNGWKTVLYKTRSTGGFDHAPNLFMIGISTPEKDIFLQTSPHPDKKPKNSRRRGRDTEEKASNDPVPKPYNHDISNAQNTLTVITVDKTQDPPVGQMRKMHRYGDKGGYEWNNTIANSSCIECHSMPLKPITPLGYKVVNGKEKRMSPEQEAQVEAMNYMLKQPVSWGAIKVGDKERRFGPAQDSYPFGWGKHESPTREDDFLKACASRQTSYSYSGFGGYKVSVSQKDLGSINYRKVAEAMSCTECHDNSNRGVLHERFSRDELAFKILIDKSMPPNATLTDDERLALFNCLKAEQNSLEGEWRKSGEWMTGPSCFGDQFKGNPPKYNPAAATPASETKSTKAVHQ